MKPIEERIRETLSRTAMVPVSQLGSDVELESLGIGSLEAIECVMALEDELELELPVRDLGTLRTVGDIIEMVERLAGDAPAR
jgi:acyl carrier protein